MERLEFECYEDLICDIDAKLSAIRELDEYNDIAIIAKYDETKELIKELLYFGYDIATINIDTKDSYDDEYVISVFHDNDDDVTQIWCEHFKRDNGYIRDDSTIQYIFENCSSKVISRCNGDIVFEVAVGEYCDCDECCNCDETELAIETKDDMHGFTVSQSDENHSTHFSFYSTDMKLVEEMAKLLR